jgi:hypothetical protein
MPFIGLWSGALAPSITHTGISWSRAMEEHEPYRAYLLRLWPTSLGGAAGYRVTLQDVATGQSVQLPDLEDLLRFLQEQRAAERTSKTLP